MYATRFYHYFDMNLEYVTKNSLGRGWLRAPSTWFRGKNMPNDRRKAFPPIFLREWGAVVLLRNLAERSIFVAHL